MKESPSQKFRLIDVSCASCVKSIEHALSTIKDIERLQINFAQRRLIVRGKVAPEKIIKAIKRAGYVAELVDEKQNIDNGEQALYKILWRKAIIGISFGIILWLINEFHIIPSLMQFKAQLLWLAIGVVIAIAMGYCGGQMFRNAWQALKHHTATMDSLIVSGTSAAWLYSMLVSLFPHLVPNVARHVYFEAAIMIIGFINLGNALEIRARGKTSQAINRLLNLQVKTAILVEQGKERQVPIDQLKN